MGHPSSNGTDAPVGDTICDMLRRALPDADEVTLRPAATEMRRIIDNERRRERARINQVLFAMGRADVAKELEDRYAECDERP